MREEKDIEGYWGFLHKRKREEEEGGGKGRKMKRED